MRTLSAALLTLLLAGSPACAVVFLSLDDEFDDWGLVSKARDRPAVKSARSKLDEFKRSLLRLKERDFVALFGRPQPKPARTYAMPVAQPRGLALSGIRYSDPAMNKDHTDFYVVPGVAALEVYFGIDGESPAAIVLYFAAGKDFPKLRKDNLEKRLAWDADRFKRLEAHTAARLAEVFPWEVDLAELAKLEAGDYETNAVRKLKAWIESGQKLGYRYQHEDGANDWSWYGPDGRLVRRASRYEGDGAPVAFEWFHPGGGELRSEHFGYRTGELQTRRWCRATGENIRYETPGTWCWYGADGRPVRQEWDDNGDGLPDWYVTAADGIAHVFDRKAMEKRRPLKLADSWAVHPELIPEDSRVSDQPDLRIPIRRRGKTAGQWEPGSGPDGDATGPDRSRWAIVLLGVVAAGLVAAVTFYYWRRRRAEQMKGRLAGRIIRSATRSRPGKSWRTRGSETSGWA
jgi:hypothetical protein